MSYPDGPPKGVFGRAWYSFSAQQIRGHHPVPTLRASALLFSLMGASMLAVGAILTSIALRQVEVKLRYDALGNFAALSPAQRGDLIAQRGPINLTVDVVIGKHMRAPIHIYYRLDKFHQNHKRYVRSRVYSQLHGLSASSSVLQACQPQLSVDTKRLRPDELQKVTSSGIINPCGLAAWSFFNDTFSDFWVSGGGAHGALAVNSSDLVWKTDRNKLYGNYEPQNFNMFPGLRGGGRLVANVSQDEHFMVWMKNSVASSVHKYWGRIDHNLQAGQIVSLTVENAFNTYEFGGQKWLILTTSSSLGGRNPVFGLVWLVAGALWCMMALVFWIGGRDRRVKRTNRAQIEWLKSRLSFKLRKQSLSSDTCSTV